jgi:hypothetical protein
MKITTMALGTAFALLAAGGGYAADDAASKTKTGDPMNGKTTTGAPTGPTMMNGTTTATGNSGEAKEKKDTSTSGGTMKK